MSNSKAIDPRDPIYLRRIAATLEDDGHNKLAAFYTDTAISHHALEEALLKLGRQTMWDGERFGAIPNGDRQKLAAAAKGTVDWLIDNGWIPPSVFVDTDPRNS